MKEESPSSAAAAGCYVVTGASRGIGAAVARLLAQRGERIVAVARHAETLATAFADCPFVRCVAADCGDDNAVEAVAAAVRETGLPVRGFVHAAGFVTLAPLGLIEAAQARDLYDTHALFPLRFLGWFAKAPNHTPNASAVLISSLACHEGDLGNAAYAAAKGAVEGMLRPAAGELVTRGIRLNALALGVVDTAMAHEAWMDGSPKERVDAVRKTYPLGFGTPRNVAEIVDFLLSPAAGWITGQCLVADGGHQVAGCVFGT